MDTNFEQQVRQRAYELWLVGGMADGRDHDHWHAAECELLGKDEQRPVAPEAAPIPKAKRAKRTSKK